MKKFIILILLLTTTLAISAPRSKEWDKVRDAFVKAHPTCAVCGTTKSIQVHHIQPFHLRPDLELDPTNLITLCTSRYPGFNCHFSVGHCGNFKWENTYLLDDIKIIHDLILKYKGYIVVPQEITEYLNYIHETKKNQVQGTARIEAVYTEKK